jgi:hypothetical protein
MSAFSSHGVGAAACANADVVSAAIAAVAKKVVFKKVVLGNLVMVILPAEK